MRIWLKTPNPLGLAEPPTWWQKLVFDYDKMLRIFPSQIEHAYRLCRRVRREARLGLQTMVIHKHPDTVLMIQHGVVPVSTVLPWAVTSTKILRDLRARDTWVQGGAEKVIDTIEKQEQRQAAAQQQEADAQQGEMLTNMFRAVKYGRPGTVLVEAGPRAAMRRRGVRRPPGSTNPPAPVRVALVREHEPMPVAGSFVGEYGAAAETPSQRPGRVEVVSEYTKIDSRLQNRVPSPAVK